jgi:hypothetical protein
MAEMASSGAIVSVVTRSGTNKNEGRAFYFARNDALDAQNPFSVAQGSGKAPFSQYRGGGFYGGPLMRDKLFYFASYEGNHIDQTSVVTVPTVPVDQREWPNPTNQNQFFVKLDNQITSTHSITGRYRVDRNMQVGNGIGGNNTHDRGADNLTRDQDGVFSDTLVLTNHALNEFRFQASQRYNNSDTQNYSPIGTPAIAQPSGNFGKAVVSRKAAPRRYRFVDNFSVTDHGDLKFGTDVSIIRSSATSAHQRRQLHLRDGQAVRSARLHDLPTQCGRALQRTSCCRTAVRVLRAGPCGRTATLNLGVRTT